MRSRLGEGVWLDERGSAEAGMMSKSSDWEDPLRGVGRATMAVEEEGPGLGLGLL